MPRTDVVLRHLGINKEHVVEYCRNKHPHLFSEIPYYTLDGEHITTVRYCSVNFKILLIKYLSDHNFKVTPNWLKKSLKELDNDEQEQACRLSLLSLTEEEE